LGIGDAEGRGSVPAYHPFFYTWKEDIYHEYTADQGQR
jgi:hypothetical protein